MKKYIYSALGLLLALASCKNTANEMSGDEISFKAQINELTKISGDSFEDGDQIAVTASLNGSELASKEYQYNGDTFTSSSPLKKNESDKFSYIATYPALKGVSDTFTFKISDDQSTAEGYSLSNLLVTQSESTNSMQPTLTFERILPTVRFAFKSMDGAEVNATNIAVSSPREIKCNIIEGSYKAQGEAEYIKPFQDDDEFSVVVVPQSYSAQDTFVTFEYDGKEYTAKFSNNTALKSGKECLLGIIINKEAGTVVIENVKTSLDEWKGQSSEMKAEMVSKTGNDIVINVEKGSFGGNFYVGTTATKYLEAGMSDKEVAESLIEAELKYYDTDFSEVDNLSVFNKSGEISIGENYNMTPDTEYQIVVCGVDDNGNILTNVVSIKATTEKVEVSGSIACEVKEITATEIVISAEPSAEVENYIFGAIPSGDYDNGQYGKTKEEVAYVVSALYRNNGFDVAVADGEIIFNGAADIYLSEMWYINPETPYTILVFGVDSEGLVTSEVTKLNATTKPLSMVEGTVEISNLRVNSSSEVLCDFTPGEGIENYLFYYAPVTTFESEFNGDYYILAKSIVYTLTNYGFDISQADNVRILNKPMKDMNITSTWGEIVAGGGENVLFTFAVDNKGNIISDYEIEHFDEPGTKSAAPTRSLGSSIVAKMVKNYTKTQNAKFSLSSMTIRK